MQTGYWRASANTTAIIRCPDASLGNSACQGGTGAPCKPALTGAYCRVCVDEWAYYDESDADCKSCALLPPETILLIGLALLLALSLIAQCLLIVRARKIEQERRDALAFADSAPDEQVATSTRHLPQPLRFPVPGQRPTPHSSRRLYLRAGSRRGTRGAPHAGAAAAT